MIRYFFGKKIDRLKNQIVLQMYPGTDYAERRLREKMGNPFFFNTAIDELVHEGKVFKAKYSVTTYYYRKHVDNSKEMGG